ncbi:MAG TPA: ferritin-like domain-containing protein [Longimicrobium sp.]|nr:ferritin-like domain-containing protein [Longimicrobium sp.]
MAQAPPPPDPDRARVRALLWDACELEHQLMLQYLFAAFTLKKFPDETCTPAQLEAVRRWTSTIMVVARQEMEHLALANGMLSAIGEDPFFARDNIPVQSWYYLGGNRARAEAAEAPDAPAPLDIPFLWEKFTPAAIRRFVCAESPAWKDVVGTDMYPSWCFAGPDPGSGLGGAGLPLSRSHVDALSGAARGAPGEVPVHPGTIPELYGHVNGLLQAHPEWFRGVPDRQVFVPVEYQLSVIKITDPLSAGAAIDQIVEEGEGIDAPPGYPSHFARFWRVHRELAHMERQGFQPALPVRENPVPDDGWRPYTRAVSELLDYAYVTLLYVLTSLYRNYQDRARPPYPTQALQNVAFGPFMTMVIRPVCEVLVHLRTHPDGRETAGPVFRLPPEEERMIWPRPYPPCQVAPGAEPVPGPPHGNPSPEERDRLAARLDDIDFILARMDRLCARVGELAGGGESAGLAGLRGALVPQAPLEWARERLEYVRESTEAMANNVRRLY